MRRDYLTVSRSMKIIPSDALQNICNQEDPETDIHGYRIDVNGFRLPANKPDERLQRMRDFPRLRRLMAFARPDLGENCDEHRLGVQPELYYRPTCWI